MLQTSIHLRQHRPKPATKGKLKETEIFGMLMFKLPLKLSIQIKNASLSLFQVIEQPVRCLSST